MAERQVATCALCGEFVVPWGDGIGEAIMAQHQQTDCPRTAARCTPAPLHVEDGNGGER